MDPEHLLSRSQTIQHRSKTVEFGKLTALGLILKNVE